MLLKEGIAGTKQRLQMCQSTRDWTIMVINRLRLGGTGVTGGLSRHLKLKKKAPGPHSCGWGTKFKAAAALIRTDAVTRGERNYKRVGGDPSPCFQVSWTGTGTDAVCDSNC